MKIVKIKENDINKRLDSFVADCLENKYARNKVASFINEGLVLVNNLKQKQSYKVKLNDDILINLEQIENFLDSKTVIEPWNCNLDIKYEDDDVIVINKPKNMLTHPTAHDREKTLCNALLYHCKTLSDIGGLDRLGIVHRLDKNTSGLIVAAKNNEAHENLAKQIKEKTAKRKYLAIVTGEFKDNEGIIDKPLLHYIKDNVKMTVSENNEGLKAVTLYKVLHQFKGAALVELELKTGRTHQIRAHLSSINHPVFGDNMYGAKQFLKKEFNNLKTTEQLLQSYYLCFEHPKTHDKMEFKLEEKDFSEDFIKVLNFLRRNNEY